MLVLEVLQVSQESPVWLGHWALLDARDQLVLKAQEGIRDHLVRLARVVHLVQQELAGNKENVANQEKRD